MQLRTKFIGVLLSASLILSISSSHAQQAAGSLRGRITDELGGLIVGAQLTVGYENGNQKVVTTDNSGNYVVFDLAPGLYVVSVSAPGFGTYQQSDVLISAGKVLLLNITLSVAPFQQEVTTSTTAALSTDPENNAGAIILRANDLEALPDDPDELASALQALAGPSAGPSGGQIFVDGYSGGPLPSKQSISEIRINQNPFAAEFDRIGLGRIDVITKPGASSFHGQALFGFSDESLNSRNPFIPRRSPYQERNYTASLSGPIIDKKASFFLDFARRETNGSTVINAIILDPALNVTTFNGAVLVPQRRTTLGARFDYQLNKTNTIVGRYTFVRTTLKNSGLTDLTLPSVAYPNTRTEHLVQLTNTALLNKSVINESRFQYASKRIEETGDNSVSTLDVLDSFIDGGAQVGVSSINDRRWEFQNHTIWAPGNHTLRIGGRIRGINITELSSFNFGGTFIFGGGLAPELDANNEKVFDENGQPRLVTITSIERYRRTLLFQQQGLSPAQVRDLGGGATQFSLAGGQRLANVRQFDFGSFIQDDWRLRPNFTLSLGLRYETQTNIHDRTDFAPRISFAWAPGSHASSAMKTVIRGGFGIFYDRISEDLTLQANRFNGINQRQFVINNPDFFPATPSIEDPIFSTSPQTIARLNNSLRTPYTMQSAISVERQLPRKLTLSLTFVNTRTIHALRSRNVNAPLPGTFDPTNPDSGIRPFGGVDNIFEYESSGSLNQNQLLINLQNRVNNRFSFFATYNLSKSNTDTDGPETFPANSYDLRSEYGRSALDTRHRFVFVGVVDLPHGFSLNPFVVMRSGLPFNVTTGRDVNGDALFTERPALVANSSAAVVTTPFGMFDTNPAVGQEIIPRNFAEGPNFIALNLRISKVFGFGNLEKSASQSNQPKRRNAASGDSQRTMNIYGNAASKGPYQLMFSVQIRNILNRTNFGLPIGNLGSTLFGQSNSLAPSSGFGISGDPLAANRRLEMQVRFSF